MPGGRVGAYLWRELWPYPYTLTPIEEAYPSLFSQEALGEARLPSVRMMVIVQEHDGVPAEFWQRRLQLSKVMPLRS